MRLLRASSFIKKLLLGNTKFGGAASVAGVWLQKEVRREASAERVGEGGDLLEIGFVPTAICL